jgi:hypothetical protein
MNAPVNTPLRPALAIARELAGQFAQTAVERDERGGTPKPSAMPCVTAACCRWRSRRPSAARAPTGTTPSRWCASSPGSTAPSPMCSAFTT